MTFIYHRLPDTVVDTVKPIFVTIWFFGPPNCIKEAQKLFLMPSDRFGERKFKTAITVPTTQTRPMPINCPIALQSGNPKTSQCGQSPVYNDRWR